MRNFRYYILFTQLSVIARKKGEFQKRFLRNDKIEKIVIDKEDLVHECCEIENLYTISWHESGTMKHWNELIPHISEELLDTTE